MNYKYILKCIHVSLFILFIIYLVIIHLFLLLLFGLFCFLKSLVGEDPTGESDFVVGDHGGSVFNGSSRILYWADGFSEIAFVVPTPAPVAASSDSRKQCPCA